VTRRAAAIFLAAGPTTAAAVESELSVERAKLAKALTCHREVKPGPEPPILFLPGTGSDGSHVYAVGKATFDALGRAVCVVAFPHRTTADVRVSVQQAAGSRFPEALNSGRDDRPGPTSWTTVRSATEDLVQPQTAPVPTAALEGARNILIQRICPGRVTSHLGTAVDSVTVAVLADAVRHMGSANLSRLPPDVCSHPYGTGLDEQQTAFFLELRQQVFGQSVASVPRVRREPRVRCWATRRGRSQRRIEGDSRPELDVRRNIQRRVRR